MLFRSFFILFTISTVFSFALQAKTKEERQPIGERSAPTLIQQPDATDVRQPVGKRETTSKSKAKKNKDRQPVGERAAPEQIQQPIASDVRQPIGTRDAPSKPKIKKKDRQPVGERAAPMQKQPIATDVRQSIGACDGRPSASNRAPQPMERPAHQSAARQPIGERAAPVQKQQPIVTDIRQPIGTREMNSMQNRAPQRIERPIQLPTATVQITQRPAIRARSLPQVILIDRRSESYGSATLTPYLISRKGDLIQLDDGSNWKVRHKDQKRVKSWNQEDLIVIETGQLFTWSIYKLVNYSRGESCDVELIQPNRNGLLSHWITEIHPFDGYLRLQDGSVWRMDTSELLTWNVNDDVIIGLSKDLFSSCYSYILINPRAKTRLLATFNLSF